jgi:ABC-2 type transport system ATP-binding protein
VGGYDVQKEPERAKKIISLVPDQPFLYQKLTGGEFLNFVADLYEVPLQLKERRIRQLLYLFEMNGKTFWSKSTLLGCSESW